MSGFLYFFLYFSPLYYSYRCLGFRDKVISARDLPVRGVKGRLDLCGGCGSVVGGGVLVCVCVCLRTVWGGARSRGSSRGCADAFGYSPELEHCFLRRGESVSAGEKMRISVGSGMQKMRVGSS